MIDIDTPDSPGWWLARLNRKLVERRERIEPLYARYEGKGEIPESLVAAPLSAQRFWRTARTNLAEMVIKAVRYRLAVTAILTPAQRGELGDPEAWRLWKQSGMLAEQHDIGRNLLISGDAYALTFEYEGSLAATAEDPRQCVTIHDPVRQSIVRAGAKIFYDADYETSWAYLYRDGRRWVARHSGRRGQAPKFSRAWDWSAEHGGADGEPTLVQMPLIRYRSEEGVGELERHGDILDRIDHLVLQGMVIATFQAFKQRGIKADWSKIERDAEDEHGEALDLDDVLAADPGAIWKLPQSADMWESGAVDLTPITSMANKEIERLSAVTFTPLWMFIQEGQNQTASGVSLVREGLTMKVLDRQDRIAYSHAQVIANLYRIAGISDPPDPADIEMSWRPAELYGLTEKYAAGQQAVSAGVPWRTRMREVLQFSPEEVARMEIERVQDEMLAASMLPEPAGPTEAGGASVTAAETRQVFEALGIAVRAGVDQHWAAQHLGISGAEFSGVPVAVRLPEQAAAGLEDR